MATVDIDPVFVKALKYLHSKAKDSGAQLKALLDDAIAQRKGLKVPTHSGDIGKSTPGQARSDDDSRKKEAEKRLLDKQATKEILEPDVKKAKIESKSKSKYEKDAKDREKERLKREKDKKEKEELEAEKGRERANKEKQDKEASSIKTDAEVAMVISDDEEPTTQMDAGDFALEMGIACVVCRQFDVSSGNQLVECQECHSLYHQECHKPPVTEEDVSDPRFVWYCFRCTKSLKMMTQKSTTKPKSATPPVTGSKEFSAPNKTSKVDTHQKSVGQAFRRIDPKQAIVASADVASLSSSASKPMVGLAGLAANLHKPKGESKGSSLSRKSDPKVDVTKPSPKPETKPSSGASGRSDGSSTKVSSSGSKSDGSSKSFSAASDEKKYDSLKSDERKYDSFKFDDKKYDHYKFDDKKYDNYKSDDKKYDNYKSDDKKYDNYKSDDKKYDNLKSDDKKYDNFKSDDKKHDSYKSDDKKHDSYKSDDKKYDNYKSVSKEEKKVDSSFKVIAKTDDKKGADASGKTSSSSSLPSLIVSREDKKDSLYHSEKKMETGKSPHSDHSRSDASDKDSPPPSSAPSTPTTPDSPTSSKFSHSASNKQAVANLSMVTANKRIQMMKKKAQAKPSSDKKVHIR